MYVSMHQPDYIPWLGYFNKIAVSEAFIFFDTADNSGGGFHNRNKIKTKQGWSYLSIPIAHSNYFIPLKDVSLPADTKWARKHWKSLKVHYGSTPYWKDHSAFFENTYNNISSFSSLSNLNISIIEYMCSAFGLTAKLMRASDLKTPRYSDPSDTIVAVLEKIGATEFLAGPSGKTYLNREAFSKANITLHFQDYHPKGYSQLHEPFIPGLSAIDLLFNEGPNSIEYLK